MTSGSGAIGWTYALMTDLFILAKYCVTSTLPSHVVTAPTPYPHFTTEGCSLDPERLRSFKPFSSSLLLAPGFCQASFADQRPPGSRRIRGYINHSVPWTWETVASVSLSDQTSLGYLLFWSAEGVEIVEVHCKSV